MILKAEVLNFRKRLWSSCYNELLSLLQWCNPCRNSRCICARGERVHVAYRLELIRNMVWCYVTQLSLFCYLSCLYIDSSERIWVGLTIKIQVFFDHQRRFSPSDNRYRSCNAQWSDAMAGWPSWTTVKADTGQPSLFCKLWRRPISSSCKLWRRPNSSSWELWEEQVCGKVYRACLCRDRSNSSTTRTPSLPLQSKHLNS